MKFRYLTIAAAGSALAFLAIMMAFQLDSMWPRDGVPRMLTLTPNLHISLDHRRYPDFEFFNSSEVGPYRGSLVSIEGDGVTFDGMDAPGAHYQVIRFPPGNVLFPNGFTWKTLRISILWFLFATAIVPGFWLRAWITRRRNERRAAQN